MKKALFFVLALVLILDMASAVTVISVDAGTLSPGADGEIRIEVENNLDETVDDVSLSLDFRNLPLIPVGSSSDSFDELEEDDNGVFTFRIRASNGIAPGDYQIPYVLTFVQDNQLKTKQGSIGVTVRAQPQISFSINVENPVINQEGKINLKIINKGFADARFVSVKAIQSGFTILSEKEIYIGSIDSDDFETATFNVVFKNQNPTFSAIIEYTDFDNKKKFENVDLPVQIYTKEKAIELGILKRNNFPLYSGIAIVIIVVLLIYSAVKKRRRMKRSLEER
mgnify:FL=1